MEVKLKRKLEIMACKVRMNIIESLYYAKSGHPGGSLSIADTITYIYEVLMKVNPNDPKNEDRNRFVLSKGHAAPALYSILALKNFFDIKELKTLRKIGSILQGHPNMIMTPGVDMSTGSLGQGISAACGMALSAKIYNKNYKVYCILGDGEMQEGQVWEAFMFAAHHKLNNLVAVIDNNGLQIDGAVTQICSLGGLEEKLKSFGWYVTTMNAHDFDDIDRAFKEISIINNFPKVIIQSSVKGKGISFMENVCSWHGMAPNETEFKNAMSELNCLFDKLGEGL